MSKPNGPIEPLLSRDAAPPLQPNDHAPAEPRPRQMLTEKMVISVIPMARSTLWKAEAAGKFPKCVYVLGIKLWYADEIAAFQIASEGQPGRRRRKGAKR
jgi:predicted DNA-binding transcriptional regulator AlpA